MTISQLAPQVPRVLIVGPGPTGLTMAIALARYGIPSRIIEKKECLSRSTKATNLMQRSQEILNALNLLEPMNDRSGFMKRLIVHAYGKCYGPRTMHLNETPFSDVALCGQHNFESVMAQALEHSGTCIEFGTELAALQQDTDGVTAEMRSAGGSEKARFEYVIGCDGANGVTRTCTRHDFDTVKTGVALRQADCKLTWRRLPTMDQLWLFYFQNGFATIVPLPGGLHRVITVEPKEAIPPRKPTLDELQVKLREVTADASLILSDADWFSYTELSMGIASGLRDGRIILAGDVGNPILPNGGQGMNTGISDAFHLSWKLASVMQSKGSEALLDTYEQERLALRKSLQNAQYNSLKYTTLVTPKWMQAVMGGVAESLLNWGGEYKMAQEFSQLAINTRRSVLTLERMGRTGLRAGDRALDAEVVCGTELFHLYDLLYAGGWTLLGFTGTRGANLAAMADAVQKMADAVQKMADAVQKMADAVQKMADAVQKMADAVQQVDKPGLIRRVISTVADAASGAEVLYDLDEIAHRAYGVTRPTLYLVRPDGHVGARVPVGEMDQLRAYISAWLPSGGPALAPKTPFAPVR